MAGYIKNNDSIVKAKNFYIKQGNKILSAKELWTKVNNQMVKVYSALNPGILLKKPDYSTAVSIPSGTYFADEDVWISILGNTTSIGHIYISKNSDMSDKISIFDKIMPYSLGGYQYGGNIASVQKGYYYQIENNTAYKISTKETVGSTNVEICCKHADMDTGVSLVAGNTYHADQDVWFFYNGRTTANLNGIDIVISDTASFSLSETISIRGISTSGWLYIPQGLYFKYNQANTSCIKYNCREK